jgi:tRNA A-37 threonylcarbamoyl transferase component Bud32/tetratricopeptide (TPR) repeat protein
MNSSDAEERLWRIARDLTESEREAAAATDPRNFPRISRYDVQELLGEGATAVVYRARDRELDLPVALKVLRETTGWSDITRQRFRREARTAAGLNDPHLVRVFDVGETPACLYLVMELVDGKPFEAVLRDGRPETMEAVRLMAKVARGVAAAHAKGIVHRDLKPANILVGRDGEPKVGDFGLAHLAESETALTRSGTVLGTPLYMAPEQALGRVDEICPRTDVYGLGAILYEALTGKPPHAARSVTELYAKIVHEETLPPRRLSAEIPRDLETVCMKALERDKGRRYATAGEFADDLERFLAGEPVEAKRASLLYRAGKRLARHRAMLGVAALVLAAVAGLFLAGPSRSQAYEAAFRRGLEFWGRRQADRAIEEFRAAAGVSPSRAEPWVMIGRAELLRGRADRASEAWEEALRRDPRCGAARFERGKEAFCRHVTARIPPAAEDDTGWIPIRLRRAEGPAARELEEAQGELREGGGSAPEARKFLDGARALAEERYAEAAPLFQAYADLNGSDASGVALLGIASHYGGDPAAAERWLSEALSLRQEPLWQKLRGDARYLRGDDEGARSDHRAAGLSRGPEPGVQRRVPSRGLVLWLRADAGVQVSDGAVRRWEDQSGLGNHAVQKFPPNGPTLSSGAVVFSNRDDQLILPDGFEDFGEGLSIFVVGERTEQTSNWSFVEFGTTPGIDIVLGRSFGDAVKFTVFDKAGTRDISAGGSLPFKSLELITVLGGPSGMGKMYRRGSLIAMSPWVAPKQVLRTQNSVGRTLRGCVAELLVYNRALSELERIGVESYLKSRHPMTR